MGRFIKLTGVTFNNPDLPKLTDLKQSIRGISSLLSWAVPDQTYASYDVNGQLKLADLADNSAEFSLPSGRSVGPVLVDNVINGKSVIRFAGDLSQVGGLKRNVEDMPTGASPVTFACVAQVTDSDSSAAQHIMSTGSVNVYGFNLYTSGTSVKSQLNPGAVTMGDVGGWQILICSAVGNVVKGLDVVDLTTVVTNTATNTNTLSTLFLGQHSLQGSKFVGDLAEAIVFADDLLDPANSNDLASVISYFKSKFAL